MFGLRGHSMNSLMKFGAAAMLAGMCSACVIVDADVQEADWASYGRAGLLYAAEVNPRGPAEVSITVHSNGCTQKEHFHADVDRQDGNRYRVRFERTTEDNCKALMPEGRRLTWSFSELGIPSDAQVVIANRVGR
jgi:hypothetical protein